MRSRVAVVASAAVAVAVLGVAAAYARPAAPSPYRVYFVGPLSGPISNYGKEFNTGLKAAAAVLNKSGGIDGHPVVISTSDDQANPSQGITLLTKELSKSTKPNLVIPGIAAFENLPYAQATMKAKILTFATQPDPTFNGSKYPYLFNLNPSYTTTGLGSRPSQRRRAGSESTSSRTTTLPASRT